MKTARVTSITDMDAFRIIGAEGVTYYGGDQHWLSGDFHKEAACGATTCANILAYFARTAAGLSGLSDFDLTTKQGFLSFMETVYPHVRPSLIGIMPADYTRGFEECISAKGLFCRIDTLTVPGARSKRPTPGRVGRFLAESLEADMPVAFLNLSAGRVKNLDSYHWVTIAAIDEAGLVATIIDNGKRLDVNVGKWLQKSTMGGAFVSAMVSETALEQ